MPGPKGWCWRYGRRGPGRRPKPRFISSIPNEVTFIPRTRDGKFVSNEPICLAPDEIEALKLVYLEDLTQEEAALRMGISRGTLWRILDDARKKLVKAIIELRPIVITYERTRCEEEVGESIEEDKY
ncbi:MAG: hypothetical protein B6V02_03765 [Thermoprotei archaeon ex4572_64]|nr:MAG: hypothetical protein B6V02_03765 [Thermoprotei archaeon ex4572_64]